MPVMDGYAVCHAIRGDDALKNTPVILLTMLSDPLDVIHGLNAGADALIALLATAPAADPPQRAIATAPAAAKTILFRRTSFLNR